MCFYKMNIDIGTKGCIPAEEKINSKNNNKKFQATFLQRLTGWKPQAISHKELYVYFIAK